jgi:hypothetical protein
MTPRTLGAAIAAVAGAAAVASAAVAAGSGGAAAPGAPGLADRSRVGAALGPEIVAALQAATRADTAKLAVIGVAEAERRTFAAPGRIAGYPIRGPVRAVAAQPLAAAVGTLLRDDSYDFETLVRCRNSSFVGARFATAPVEVELALGKPCNQAVWAFRKGGARGPIQRWGGLLSPQAAAAVMAALGPVPEAGRPPP